MALTVENGTGLANADSFVSVADADTYWAARNDTAWAAAEVATKEAALRMAAEYIGFAYRWTGFKRLDTQSLAWPRVSVSDVYGLPVSNAIVPNEVRQASFLLAKEALTTDLLAPTDKGDSAIEESVSLGKITQTRKYAENSIRAPGVRSFAIVDAILSALMATQTASTGGIGAVKLLDA